MKKIDDEIDIVDKVKAIRILNSIYDEIHYNVLIDELLLQKLLSVTPYIDGLYFNYKILGTEYDVNNDIRVYFFLNDDSLCILMYNINLCNIKIDNIEQIYKTKKNQLLLKKYENITHNFEQNNVW